MLRLGEFATTERTLEDPVDNLLVLGKLWAKAAGTYFLVNGIGKKSVDFGHQREYLLVLSGST